MRVLRFLQCFRRGYDVATVANRIHMVRGCLLQMQKRSKFSTLEDDDTTLRQNVGIRMAINPTSFSTRTYHY
jgi:hypothetical protein